MGSDFVFFFLTRKATDFVLLSSEKWNLQLCEITESAPILYFFFFCFFFFYVKNSLAFSISSYPYPGSNRSRQMRRSISGCAVLRCFSLCFHPVYSPPNHTPSISPVWLQLLRCTVRFFVGVFLLAEIFAPSIARFQLRRRRAKRARWIFSRQMENPFRSPCLSAKNSANSFSSFGPFRSAK